MSIWTFCTHTDEESYICVLFHICTLFPFFRFHSHTIFLDSILLKFFSSIDYFVHFVHATVAKPLNSCNNHFKYLSSLKERTLSSPFVMEVPHSLLVCLGLSSVLVFKEKPKIALRKFARDTIFYPFSQLVL